MVRIHIQNNLLENLSKKIFCNENSDQSRIFSPSKMSITFEHALMSSKIQQFLDDVNLKEEILCHTIVLRLPLITYTQLKMKYNEIKYQEYFEKNNFSFEDFMLAKMAEYIQCAVSSYDHHITQDLHQYCHYDSFIPEDWQYQNGSNLVLLDTNVILALKNKRNSRYHQSIRKFLMDSTFIPIIIEPIEEELYNLKDNFSGDLKDSGSKLHPQKGSKGIYLWNMYDGVEPEVQDYELRESKRTHTLYKNNKSRTWVENSRKKWIQGKYSQYLSH